MKNKNNYFDNPNTDEERLIRTREKRKPGRVILLVFLLIAVAAATFLLTVKIAQPDFDFKRLVPKQITQFVDEIIPGRNGAQNVQATQAAPEITTQQVTEQVTEPEDVPAAYVPYERFKFKTEVQGNYMGNILGGGKVGTDMTYIYHAVDGYGIYRFTPSTENYSRIYKTDDRIGSLNLRGDYIYFVNETENKLYRMKKSESSPVKIADSAKIAYVYDNRIYYISENDEICTMTADKLSEKVLYTAEDGEAQLVGISLDGVYFTVTDSEGRVQYFTASNKSKGEAQRFMGSTDADEIVSLTMENGFMYFYKKQQDGSYSLCRRKFGSENIVTLAENVTCTAPAIADKNRLFYGVADGSRFSMTEINMNTSAVKNMVSVKGVKDGNALVCQHGGSYDFVIGKKLYAGSCIDTSSTNVMYFEDGSWSY